MLLLSKPDRSRGHISDSASLQKIRNEQAKSLSEMFSDVGPNRWYTDYVAPIGRLKDLSPDGKKNKKA